MPIDRDRYNQFLEAVAETITIPRDKHKEAMDRYESVKEWLEDGDYPGCVGRPSVYLQGSFRLGTVVRPIRGGVEADYDIDLVCELPIQNDSTDARSVKTMVGDRLRSHPRYRRLLEREGKRCWTLKYREQDGVGFHLDVLPSVPDSHWWDHSILITHKRGAGHEWSASNPKDYGDWFDWRNRITPREELNARWRRTLTQQSPVSVPVHGGSDRRIDTPLQRSVQIMKRHRDVMFNRSKRRDYQPISIVITTLAAQTYRGEQHQGERDVCSVLTEIVTDLHRQAVLANNRRVDNAPIPLNLIERTRDDRWYIDNPVTQEENFADRWHENNDARAKAFFNWAAQLKGDLVNILDEDSVDRARRRLSKALGASAVSGHLDLIASADPLESAHRGYISR